jgi:hypothetical protein
MKHKKLRLTLDVDFDPQGLSVTELKQNLSQVVTDAVNDGTLTGNSPATVEKYSFKVTVRRPRKGSGKKPVQIHRILADRGPRHPGKVWLGWIGWDRD